MRFIDVGKSSTITRKSKVNPFHDNHVLCHIFIWLYPIHTQSIFAADKGLMF